MLLTGASTKSRLRPSKRGPAVAAGLSTVLIIAWSTMIEWEWSFVDDPAQKAAVTELTRKLGLLPGVWQHIQDQASGDWKGWGLFRPVWYVYAGLFYLASPAVAHGVRLGMLLIVFLVPAFRLARTTASGRNHAFFVWALCLLLANNTLYQTLTFLSLQELTGLTFAALGLATSNRCGRSVLWLAAAWMKTPFVWLFLAWGVFLFLRRRTRTTGLLVVSVGVLTIVAAAISARAGNYTTSFVVSPAKILGSAREALPLFYWPGLTGLLGLIAFRPRLKTIDWRDPLALVLAAGGIVYFANLLPWGSINAYYGSPAIWMLSAAAIRLGATAELQGWSGRWRQTTSAVLALTVLLTGALLTKIIQRQYERNDAVVNLRDFVLSLKGRPVVAINGSEASTRLEEIVLMHRRDWDGTIIYVEPDDATTRADYYVKLADQSAVNTRLAENPIHTWPAATVYDP